MRIPSFKELVFGIRPAKTDILTLETELGEYGVEVMARYFRKKLVSFQEESQAAHGEAASERAKGKIEALEDIIRDFTHSHAYRLKQLKGDRQ